MIYQVADGLLNWLFYETNLEYFSNVIGAASEIRSRNNYVRWGEVFEMQPLSIALSVKKEVG